MADEAPTKLNIRQWNLFCAVADRRIPTDPKGRPDEKRMTKLGFCLRRVGVQGEKISARMSDEMETLNNRHCAVYAEGEKKDIIIKTLCGTDRNGQPIMRYEFTKDGGKAHLEERIKLENNPIFEVTPCFCSKLPSDLTDLELQCFKGIVIRPEDVDRIYAEREAAADAVDYTPIEPSESNQPKDKTDGADTTVN